MGFRGRAVFRLTFGFIEIRQGEGVVRGTDAESLLFLGGLGRVSPWGVRHSSRPRRRLVLTSRPVVVHFVHQDRVGILRKV